MPSNFPSNGSGLNPLRSSTFGAVIPLTVVAVRETVQRKPIRWIIKGVTKDYLGAVLGGVTLECYLSIRSPIVQPQQRGVGGSSILNDGFPTGRMVNMTVSNATTGAYRMEVNTAPGNLYQIDAYLNGSPDRAGTTVNTLQPNLETDA